MRLGVGDVGRVSCLERLAATTYARLALPFATDSRIYWQSWVATECVRSEEAFAAAAQYQCFPVFGSSAHVITSDHVRPIVGNDDRVPGSAGTVTVRFRAICGLTTVFHLESYVAAQARCLLAWRSHYFSPYMFDGLPRPTIRGVCLDRSVAVKATQAFGESRRYLVGARVLAIRQLATAAMV